MEILLNAPYILLNINNNENQPSEFWNTDYSQVNNYKDWEELLDEKLLEMKKLREVNLLPFTYFENRLFNLIKNHILVSSKKNKRITIENFAAKYSEINKSFYKNNNSNILSILNSNNQYNLSYLFKESNNNSGGSQYINIKNYGKRKIRYQKNGRAYVIVNKKKLKL